MCPELQLGVNGDEHDETKAVIEDCRANAIGGIIVGLEIWELAILPHLLNNSVKGGQFF